MAIQNKKSQKNPKITISVNLHLGLISYSTENSNTPVLHNRPYGNWSMATNPYSFHLRYNFKSITLTCWENTAWISSGMLHCHWQSDLWGSPYGNHPRALFFCRWSWVCSCRSECYVWVLPTRSSLAECTCRCTRLNIYQNNLSVKIGENVYIHQNVVER